MDFESRHFKSIDLKSKSKYPNATLMIFEKFHEIYILQKNHRTSDYVVL